VTSVAREARRAAVLVCSLLALATCATPARADANAETLFQMGKAAMARKDYPAACRYFEESLKLEDALGTLLNLAACHEEIGRVGTAWGEYRAVEQRSLRASPPQQDRANAAHARAEALFPRLSRVHVAVAEGARVEGLEVKIDGVVAPPSLWEVGVVVDPGKRQITASAPERKPWSSIASIDDEGVNATVNVPLLEPLPKSEKPANPTLDPVALEAMQANRARRNVGYVVGVGLAALGFGATMGVLAIGKAGDSRCASPCPVTVGPDD
jgi:hypothetical protein